MFTLFNCNSVGNFRIQLILSFASISVRLEKWPCWWREGPT